MTLYEKTMILPDGRTIQYRLEGADRLSAVRSCTLDGEPISRKEMLALIALVVDNAKKPPPPK